MELSSKSINKLKALADNDKYSLKLFSLLVTQIFESFDLNQKLDINFDYKIFENEINMIDLKDAVAILYTLISELAKHNAESNTIVTFLEDCGFGIEKINLFLEAYDKKIRIIRLYLSSLSTSYPHIVDVKWRLDYLIKESNMERLNEPNYIVELVVEEPNEKSTKNLTFNCNLEQLQDLIYKLKEATRSIERLGQS